MTTAKILVTGAAGLIGGALVRRLAAERRSVVAADVRSAGEPGRTPFETVDLEDRIAMATLVRKHAVDVIVHCGAISGPMGVTEDPCRAMAINVSGALNVAEAARTAKVSRLIALSSIAVYGDQESSAPVRETAPLNARDIYGASKIAMETVLGAYRNDFGLPAVAFRIASVYGPGRTTPCFVRDMIASAATGIPFSVSADEICRRQFVHIDDVVQALVQAIDARDLTGFAYNVGGGTWLTEREVAEIAAKVLPQLELYESGAPAGCVDGRMGPLDSSLAERMFGYHPHVGLAQGIASYAEHLKHALV